MRLNYDANIARAKAVADERYRWMDAYKVEHGCAVCGYNEDPRALDFDHTDPATKVDNISRLIRHAPWAKVLAEMDKCTILCANHHRVKTFSRQQEAGPAATHSDDDGTPAPG